MTAATKAVHIHLRGNLPRDSFREGWGELTKRKSPHWSGPTGQISF